MLWGVGERGLRGWDENCWALRGQEVRGMSEMMGGGLEIY